MKQDSFQVVVVPGVPYYGTEMSDIMRMRVLWAKHLYDKGVAKHIIFSGSAVYTPYVEGEVMAAYAEKLGIPRSAISIEPEAEHSTENLYYAYKMAQKAGYERIALTTDPFQSYFLKIFAEEQDLKIDFLPFQFNMDSIFEVDLSTIKIEVEACAPFVSLNEREGFFQRFRGTLGKHILHNPDNEIFLIEE